MREREGRGDFIVPRGSGAPAQGTRLPWQFTFGSWRPGRGHQAPLAPLPWAPGSWHPRLGLQDLNVIFFTFGSWRPGRGRHLAPLLWAPGPLALPPWTPGGYFYKKKDISFVKKINNIKNKKNPNFILYFQLSRIHFGWAWFLGLVHWSAYFAHIYFFSQPILENDPFSSPLSVGLGCGAIKGRSPYLQVYVIAQFMLHFQLSPAHFC